MRKIIAYITITFILFSAIFTNIAIADVITPLDQFTATTVPITAITQRTYGKAIKLTGLTNGSNLCLDSNGLITTSGCSGGGGGGTFPFTPATNFNRNTNSTTSILWLRGSPYSLFASSTSIFDYASTTALSATSLYADGLIVNNNLTITNGTLTGNAWSITPTGVFNGQAATAVSAGTANSALTGANTGRTLVSNNAGYAYDENGVPISTLLSDVSTYGNYANLTFNSFFHQLGFVANTFINDDGTATFGGILTVSDTNNASVFPYASTTVTSADQFCLTSSGCISTWPLGSGGADPFTHPATKQSATTSLMLFYGNASSSQFSVFSKTYFGGTATTTIDSLGNLLVAGSTTLQNFTASNGTTTFATSTSLFGTVGRFGTLTLTNALTVSNGGTGQNTLTSGQLLYGSGTNPVQSVATTTLTATSPLSLSNPIVVIGGPASALTLSTAGTWSGNAGTATALAANGTNCSAGNYPLGVDASGNSENCTAASAGTITGGGTTGMATVFTGSSAIGASSTPTFDHLFASSTNYSILIGGLLTFASSTFQNITANNATTSQLITNNLLALSSTTLQNFTAQNATTSQATTTNLSVSSFADFSNALVSEHVYSSYHIPATTTWTGSTSDMFYTSYKKETWNSIKCPILGGSGTLNVQLYNSSLKMNMIPATTASSTQSLTTNNVLPPDTEVTIEIGTPASNPNGGITCTIDRTINK